MMIDKVFVATKGYIVHKGKVLILRESSAYEDGSKEGKFDLVGGRLSPGERFDEGLQREIKEETGLDVIIGRPFFVGEWRPVVRGENWQVVATFFVCKATSDHVTLSKDHDEYRWIDPQDYENHPIIENLQETFAAYLDLER